MRITLKQSIIKRLLCVALSVVLIAGFAPLRAEAYTQKYSYHVTNLKAKTYVKAKGSVSVFDGYTWTDNYYLYRIKVPANGYIKLQTTKSSNDFGIYKNYKKNKGLSNSIYALYERKNYYLVLPKGTYYIRANSGAKFKWSFVKTNNTKNYCRARATALKRNKKTTVVFNYKYEYARWFKIKLAKRKTITIISKSLENANRTSDIKVFDSNGCYVETSSLTDISKRTKILPKGTYYIRVSRSNDDESEYGLYHDRIYQFTWK